MDHSPPNPVAEATRQACLRAAMRAYEDAKIRGLCHEGAWECAVDAIRCLKLQRPMIIEIKRVYDEPTEQDGTRVLIDRLWPRGLTREDARFDVWAKDLAPSPELRKWFGHDPEKFDRFADRYRKELSGKQTQIDTLLQQIDRYKKLTLLYAAKDQSANHAVVLKSYLTSS